MNLDFLTPEFVLLAATAVVGLAILILFVNARTAMAQKQSENLHVLESRIEERQGILREIGNKSADRSVIAGEVERLQQRKEQVERDLPALEEKLTLKVTEYEQALTKLQEIKQNSAEQEEKHRLYKERIARLEELASKISELEKKKEEMESVIASLPEKIKELKELEADLKKQNSLKDEALAKLDEINKDLESGKEQLRKINEEVQNAQSTLANAKKQLVETEKEQIRKEKDVEALSDKIKTAGRLPDGAFESLDVAAFSIPGETRDQEKEEEMLDRVSSYTERAKFDLPKRLQYAFHTALKTSDISCLTVMAGVSGTGKSAFPKLYSKAAGLHFLPLAVEPRWDSPQDLFGFLNYVENRFESTSLGRALVQFNNAPVNVVGNMRGKLADQILLVLLDEMNLARIEYYFSEFLSKLEMRRNVGLNNMTLEEYRVVSTEIFGGYPEDPAHDRKAMDAIRLYAGSNVLFVGTMNEDESTQSLSDKVIDRANVLHFGKPDTMRLIGDRGEANLEDMPPITHETWKSWLQEPQIFAHQHPDVVNSLNEINGILARLGRPFGWRTFQAILAYIANHPQVILENGSPYIPLADQVAMRVMPKLRGVDTEEHAEVISQLNALIQNLGDDALSTAFHQATGSGRGWFDWKGIDWSA